MSELADDTQPPDHHLASHLFNLAVLAGGTIGLAVLLNKLGWANANQVLRGVGAWFGAIVGLDVIGLCLDAAAIRQFMRPEARMVSYWRVLCAQASGRAINIFVPGGVVGEATKVAMLVTHAPRDRVLASIVLFNLATFYISVAIVMIGVPITALVVHLPRELAIVVWIALAILIPIVIALGVIIHRGAIGIAANALRRVRILSAARVASWQKQIEGLDAHLKELHSGQSPGTRAGLALLLVSRLVAWCATATVLHAVGVELSATVLVGVLSVGVLISWVSALVPFGLGIADGSNYALFDVLGASGAHGLFVTMLGRARSIAIALIGLAMMGVAHAANRASISQRNRRRRDVLARRAVDA
ncbi:MAG TPA: lysylphosphatidylglycerol synthase transmembrane domain-containing protein [Kofleriaceae bacterium]|nr:lysylphosphatidylglycerol synthase transmembrane domain-containing protein [Kofleriaceae bacterium]